MMDHTVIAGPRSPTPHFNGIGYAADGNMPGKDAVSQRVRSRSRRGRRSSEERHNGLLGRNHVVAPISKLKSVELMLYI